MCRLLLAEAKKGGAAKQSQQSVLKKGKYPAPRESSPRWPRSRWNPEHWRVPPWNLFNCIKCLPPPEDTTKFDQHKNGLGLMFYRRSWQFLEPTYWTITKARFPANGAAKGVWGILTWRGQPEPVQRKIRFAEKREWWHLKDVANWTREPHVKRFLFPEESKAECLAGLEAKRAAKEAKMNAPPVEYPPNRQARRAANKGRGKAASVAAPAAKK